MFLGVIDLECRAQQPYVIDELLMQISTLDGVDGVSIVDGNGFSSRGFPQGMETEKLAANVRGLIEKSDLDNQGIVTLIGERGYILAFHLCRNEFLAIQADKNAILGTIRSKGSEIAARIANLMTS